MVMEDYLIFLILISSLTLWFAIFRRTLTDYVFLVRSALVFSPGLILYATITLLGPVYGYFLHDVQSQGNANYVLLLSLIGLFSSSFGWVVGRAIKRDDKAVFGNVIGGSKVVDNQIIIILIALFLTSGFLSGLGRELLLFANYGDSSLHTNNASTGMFAFLSLVIFSFLLMMRLGERMGSILFFVFVLASLYVFLFEFLMKGRRLEVLAVFIIYIAARSTFYPMDSDRSVSVRGIVLSSILIGFFLYLWGVLRSQLFSMISDGATGVVFPQSDFISFPTITNISLTILLVVKMISAGNEFILGQSYFDFFPRTLPEFIYADRPSPLSADVTLQGGIHEIAEAYLNFGVFGVLVVPFVISFFLGMMRSFAGSGGYFTKIFYLCVCGALVRGVWYQTFTLYKSSLVAFFFLMAIFLLAFMLGVIYRRSSNCDR